MDINSCRESTYTILLEPGSGSPLFRVGYEVDAAGKQVLINIGRAIGRCSTCQNNVGSLQRGFRAEVRGRILELGNQNGPHKFEVLSAQASYNLTSICPALEGSNTTTPASAPVLPPSTQNVGFLSRILNFIANFFGSLFGSLFG